MSEKTVTLLASWLVYCHTKGSSLTGYNNSHILREGNEVNLVKILFNCVNAFVLCKFCQLILFKRGLKNKHIEIVRQYLLSKRVTCKIFCSIKLLSELITQTCRHTHTHTHTHTHIWTTSEERYSFVYVSGFLGILSPSSSPCFICFALFSTVSFGSPVTLCTAYGGAWPMSTIVLMMFTTSIKSGCNWNVLPRVLFPQQLLLPRRIHLPDMSTSGKSVAVAAYDPQSKAWHQQIHEAMRRKELRPLKTIPNPPLCPLQEFRQDFLFLKDGSS